MGGVDLLPAPKFGDWLRGIYASESNPQRDGMYVRTIRRSGRMNPGKYYEVTDGNGKFWQYPAQSTERIDRANIAHASAANDAEIEALRAKTAVTMGVGTGDGNLFVHGDYESIKAAQEIVLERDALRAEVGRLQTKAAGAVDAARGYQRELAAEYARAERLVEALQKIAEYEGSSHSPVYNSVKKSAIARAALEQEGD